MSVVGFDFDETLADTAAAQVAVFTNVLRRYIDFEPHTVYEGLAQAPGAKLEEQLSIFLPSSAVLSARKFFMEIYPIVGVPLVSAMPGALEIIENLLGDGHEVHVVSAKSRLNLDLCMERIGLTDLPRIGGVRGDEKTHALKQINAQVYFGDQVSDVCSAKSAGATSVLICKEAPIFLTQMEEPDFQFQTLSEARSMLYSILSTK